MIRTNWNDQIVRTQKAKHNDIIAKVNIVNSNGQQLFIFTSSVDKS